MKKISIVLLCFIIISCIPATIPRFIGCNVFNVISGSMEPDISVGSAVFVKNAEAADIVEGDVISFNSSMKSDGIVTHRVIENNSIDKQFITKGDANQDADIFPVSYNQLIGKVCLTIPMYGFFLAFLSNIYGKIIIVVAIISLALFCVTKDKEHERG